MMIEAECGFFKNLGVLLKGSYKDYKAALRGLGLIEGNFRADPYCRECMAASIHW